MELLAGIYRGLVVDHRDPQARKRLLVKVPQLMGDVPLGDWAEPCLPAVTASGALMQRAPAAGEMVWVMFEGGDIDHPVWMGVQT